MAQVEDDIEEPEVSDDEQEDIPPKFPKMSTSAEVKLNKKEKTNSLSTSGLNDIQNVRAELSSQVQIMQQQQEVKMHTLESQINEMEKKLQPDIQKLEHSQEEAKNQLNRVRDRITQMENEDINPLQRQYDTLAANFERFVRMDVENKLKPMQDDVKASKAKLADLTAATDTNMARLDESIKAIAEKVESTSDNLKNQQSKISTQFDELVPKVGQLEHKVQLLSNLIEDSPQISAGTSGLKTQLNKTQQILTNLTEEVIPTRINETKDQFEDAINQLNEYCKKRISDISVKLDQLKKENEAVTENRRKAHETMTTLIQSSQDTKEKLKNLQDTIKSRISKLNSEMEASLNATSESAKDLNSESQNGETAITADVDEEVSNRKKQVMLAIRKLQENMKRDFGHAERAQTQSLQKLNEIKDSIEGEHNCVGRLKDVRMKLKTAIETIQTYNAARIEDDQNGISPLQIGARLQNIEKRLLETEERLAKLDGKKSNGKAPYVIKVAVEKIDPLPEVPKPSSLPGARKRRLRNDEEEDEELVSQNDKSQNKKSSQKDDDNKSQNGETPSKKDKTPTKDDNKSQNEETPQKKPKKPANDDNKSQNGESPTKKDKTPTKDDDNEKTSQKKPKKPANDDEDEPVDKPKKNKQKAAE